MIDTTYLMHLQQLFKDMHGLNINYIENFNADLSVIDHGLRNLTNQAAPLYKKLQKIISTVDYGTVCMINDSFLQSYVVFLTHSESESFYTIGPFRSYPYAESDYERIQVENHLDPAELERIKKDLINIPSDIQRHIPVILAKNLLNMLHPSLEISIQNITIDVPPSTPKDDIAAHIQFIETSYHHESLLMHYISEGNHAKALHEAKFFFNDAKSQGMGDTRVKHKGLLYTSNTLFRKAAQSAGIHPLYLDEISSRFAKQLGACKTHEELDDTYLSMVNDYCTLCRDYDKQKYSEPVQKIINYILSNISADLSPSEIAHFVNFSPSYVSKKFKEEVGTTLNNYVTEQRIRIAKKLLQNNNMQVQDIAAYVGIPDWNYFTKLFKKVTGTTPRNYRKSLE